MPPNPSLGAMSFSIPSDLVVYLHEIDNFIDSTISPLQASNDNERFFDHRREHARVQPADFHSILSLSDRFGRPTGIIMVFRAMIGKSY